MTGTLSFSSIVRIRRPHSGWLNLSDADRQAAGLLHFYAGVLPKGSIVQVSVWDTDEHASQLDGVKEMAGDGRRDMEAVGVTSTPIFNYPIDWARTSDLEARIRNQ